MNSQNSSADEVHVFMFAIQTPDTENTTSIAHIDETITQRNMQTSFLKSFCALIITDTSCHFSLPFIVKPYFWLIHSKFAKLWSILRYTVNSMTRFPNSIFSLMHYCWIKVLKSITYVTWFSGTISDLDHFYISLWISPSTSPFSCLIYSLCTNQAVSISHFVPFLSFLSRQRWWSEMHSPAVLIMTAHSSSTSLCFHVLLPPLICPRGKCKRAC